jgi:PPOX class probable F420-dependent enzyme
MPDKLSAKARELLARPVLATLATVAGDGSPQVTPLWIEVDGDDLLVNTARGRAKARNVERDHRVALSVIDPDDPYNVVVVKGTVVDVTTEGADAHIDRLAKKYLGVDEYPMRQPGEVRLTVRIRTDRIPMQAS